MIIIALKKKFMKWVKPIKFYSEGVWHIAEVEINYLKAEVEKF